MQKDVQKQNFTSENSDPVSLFQLNIENQSMKDLNLTQKKLNFICHDFDPYNQESTSIEVKNILNEFHLESYTENPFQFTNILLQLMDNLEQLIKSKLN